MANIIFSFAITVFSCQLAASQSVDFSYDANGNRTLLKYNSIKPDKPSITQNGDELVSSATSNNQWFFENDSIPGATSQRYRPTQSGNYKVRVRNKDCVSEFSALKNVVITAVVNLPNGQFIKFGPNPVSDHLNLYFNINNIYKLDVMIADVNGKEILRQTLGSGGAIPMNKLTGGVYLLTVRGKEKQIISTFKIVKIN